MTSAAPSTDLPVAVVAEVVPLVPAWRLSRTFSYVVPEKLLGKVEPGSLVRIPLGGRKVRGIVVEISTGTEPGREEIAGLVIPVPVARPPVTDLLEWISERYVSPKGQTFARAVPPRVRAKAPEGADLATAEEPKIVPAYLGGRELLDAIAQQRSGTWSLRVALGEDRGR